MFKTIPDNSKLLVAVSGGPDSVFLLSKLLNQQTKKKLTLHIAHYNHHLRFPESNLDQKFVQNLAQRLNLPLTINHHTKPDTQKSEEILRKKRYQFLKSLRIKLQFDYIVTAHNLDDQIETIIFNFFRGTGPTGLYGMKTLSNHILRPMLTIPKSKILAYLQKNQIEYCVDQTNFDTNLNRNLIRHQILPLIKQINQNPASSIINLSQILSTQEDYINQQTFNFLQKYIIESKINLSNWPEIINHKSSIKQNVKNSQHTILVFPLKPFLSLHFAIQTSLIKKIITPFVPANKQLKYKTILEVVKILNHSQGGSQKILFDILSIHKKNDKIYLRLIK